MGMNKVYGNSSYQVMNVNFAKGEAMPRHFASSDAFIIVEKGRAKISFYDREETLEEGGTLHIPARESHDLKVLEDFNAFIVLAADTQAAAQ